MNSNSIGSQTSSGFSFSFGLERSVSETPAAPEEAVVPIQTKAPSAAEVSAYMNSMEMKRLESAGGHLRASDEQFMKMLDRAFKVLDGRSTSIQFQVHDKTNQLVIKVADRDTGEIIREIPPEKSLDFLAKVQEMLGLIIDVRR